MVCKPFKSCPKDSIWNKFNSYFNFNSQIQIFLLNYFIVGCSFLFCQSVNMFIHLFAKYQTGRFYLLSFSQFTVFITSQSTVAIIVFNACPSVFVTVRPLVSDHPFHSRVVILYRHKYVHEVFWECSLANLDNFEWNKAMIDVEISFSSYILRTHESNVIKFIYTLILKKSKFWKWDNFIKFHQTYDPK